MASHVSHFLPEVTSRISPTIPPMPVIRDFKLAWCYGSKEVRAVSAVVDSGADYSSVPWEWADKSIAIGIRSRVVAIQLPDGSEKEFFYLLLRYKIPDVMPDWDVAGFLVMDEYLVGRNILQKFVVTLDGPAQELRISSRA